MDAHNPCLIGAHLEELEQDRHNTQGVVGAGGVNFAPCSRRPGNRGKLNDRCPRGRSEKRRENEEVVSSKSEIELLRGMKSANPLDCYFPTAGLNISTSFVGGLRFSSAVQPASQVVFTSLTRHAPGISRSVAAGSAKCCSISCRREPVDGARIRQPPRLA